MSADSTRKQSKQGFNGHVVLPQPISDPSIIESVAGFIHEVVPQVCMHSLCISALLCSCTVSWMTSLHPLFVRPRSLCFLFINSKMPLFWRVSGLLERSPWGYEGTANCLGEIWNRRLQWPWELPPNCRVWKWYHPSPSPRSWLRHRGAGNLFRCSWQPDRPCKIGRFLLCYNMTSESDPSAEIFLKKNRMKRSIQVIENKHCRIL